MDETPDSILEAEDQRTADYDLGQRGIPGSLLHTAIWLLIILVTPVASDYPLSAWFGLLILTMLGVMRLLMGTGFERLYPGNPGRWYAIYAFVVLSQATIWGLMNAGLIWIYTTDWPAMLMSFATAGVVAGGTISTSTHRSLQKPYVVAVLLPSTIACFASFDQGAMTIGALFAANLLFLLAVGKQLAQGYRDKQHKARLLQRRAEELELAWHQAASADRAKSEFVARVSHELRTPLNGLISTVDLMRRDREGVQHDKRINILSQSANLLLKRINEILDFSKLEAEKLVIDSTPFAPTELVRESAALMADEANRKGLALHTETNGSSNCRVVGDPLRTMQVLLNLLSNAIKFTEEGEVRLSCAIEPMSNGRVICSFAVSDTGTGIPQEVQERIFESFVQADGSTSRKYGGTGLGLAVSRRIVRLMGSDIGVKSQPDEGSMFSFELELEQAAAQDEDEDTETRVPEITADLPDLRLRVLVAEDNPVNQVVVEEVLASLGCTCELVDNGRRCVEMAGTKVFDVILMDCEMPGMDGYTAARLIGADVDAPPILALTAHTDEANRTRAEESGMIGYVTKPFSLMDLAMALEEWAPVGSAYPHDLETPGG